MADALLPPLAAAAGLMLLAGLAKLRSPGPAQAALSAFGLPAGPMLARGIGAAEATVGALCLLAPGRPATIALAAAYLALGAATGVRLARGERQAPCGCFGNSAALHLGHLLLNLAFAAVAAAAFLAPPTSLAQMLGRGPAALVLVAGVGCSIYLALALLALFPDAWRAFGGEDA
jgi:Methylamine utilisation protein MauE